EVAGPATWLQCPHINYSKEILSVLTPCRCEACKGSRRDSLFATAPEGLLVCRGESLNVGVDFALFGRHRRRHRLVGQERQAIDEPLRALNRTAPLARVDLIEIRVGPGPHLVGGGDGIEADLSHASGELAAE